jgi:hypothetical protein
MTLWSVALAVAAAVDVAATTTPAPPPNPVVGERSDGRLDPPPSRRWRLAPQVLWAPFRGLVWLFRLPIGAALRFEDRAHPLGRISSWLTWNDGLRGLRPAFYYSTIYVPEFGLRYFDHLSLGTDTRLSVVATVGGAHYVYAAASAEPTPMSKPVGVVLDALFDRRGDLLYNGFGSHTHSAAPAGRYLVNALEGRVGLRVRALPWLGLFATVSSGFKRFGNGDRVGGDPGVIFVYDTTTIPGFDHGTTFVRGGAGFIADIRDDAAQPSTGALVQVSFDYTHGVGDDRSSYERLRGLLGVPINLWAHTHVLWLQAATMLAWPNDDTRPIPFSELPTLGGPSDLRGFRFQDFRDFTSFYVTAEYRWPVWMWVDGAFFFDYGGVFGRNYSGFGARQMQPDVGVSLRLVTRGHFWVRMQLGYGFGEGVNFSLAGDQ